MTFDPTTETREEFMTRYQAGTPAIPDIFLRHLIALPCDCDDGGGPTHWAAVSRDPLHIQQHLELYAPSGTPWPVDVPPPTF